MATPLSPLEKIFNRNATDARLIPRQMVAALPPGQRSDIEKYVSPLQQPLPPEKSLPGDMRHLLNSIRDLPPAQKMEKIHEFTLQTIQYTHLASDDHAQTFSHLMNARTGSCREVAEMEAGLLRYAGFKGNDIALVTGQVKYKHDNIIDDNSHVVCMVRTDNHLTLLDMNLTKPAALDNHLRTKEPAISTMSNTPISFAMTTPASMTIMMDKGDYMASMRGIQQVQNNPEPFTNPGQKMRLGPPSAP